MNCLMFYKNTLINESINFESELRSNIDQINGISMLIQKLYPGITTGAQPKFILSKFVLSHSQKFLTLSPEWDLPKQ